MAIVRRDNEALCRFFGERAFDSATSQTVFGENRFDLGVGRKLAALHLGLSLDQVRLFLGRQRKNRLLVTGIGKKHAGGLFKQFRHVKLGRLLK